MTALSLITPVNRLFNWVSGGPNGSPPPSPAPWIDQLAVVALRAWEAFNRLTGNLTENELVIRYIIMDLLDVLTARGVSTQSPFENYGKLTGSFSDQFRFSWDDLRRVIFVGDRATQTQACNWGKGVYNSRTFATTDENLHWGIKIWEAQPKLVIDPSPISGEIALPRLLAYLFTESLWHATQAPIALSEFRQLLQESLVVALAPSKAINVTWSRLRYRGLSHLAQLSTDMRRVEFPDVIAARFALMQTCIYYALIRGKLHRVGIGSLYLRDLDAALDSLISLLITEVNK